MSKGLLLLLLLLVATVLSSPPRKLSGIPGAEEFLFHKSRVADLRHVYNTEKFVNGIRYSLVYDVTHSAPTHSLFDQNHVDTLCDESSLRLAFASAQEAHSFASGVAEGHIVAGHADSCGHLLRKLGAAPRVLDNVVHLDAASPIELHEAFSDAEVSFHSSRLPLMSLEDFSSEPAREVRHRKRLFDWISGLWSSVTNFIDQVGNLATGIYEGAKILWSGDLSADKRISTDVLGWNWAGGGAAQSIPLGFGAQCDACYSNLNVAFVFKLSIVNYSLKKLEAYVTGTANLGVGVTISGNNRKEFTKNLATLKAPPLAFTIGVIPVLIKTTLPITGGVIFETKISSQISGSVKAVGQVTMGMAWNPVRSAIEPLNSQSYTQSGRLALAAGTASAGVYVQTVCVFDINYIGGPNVAIRAYAETVVEGASSACGNGPRATINLGLQVSLGARLDIARVVKKDFKPVLVFEAVRSVVNGCLRRTVRRQREDEMEVIPAPWLEASAWHGMQMRTNKSIACELKYPQQVDITLQLIRWLDQEQTRGTFMLAGNSIGDSRLSSVRETQSDVPLGYCVFQHSMNATVDRGRGTLTMEPHEDDAMDFSFCAECAHEIHASVERFSFGDGFALKSISPDGCLQTYLVQ